MKPSIYVYVWSDGQITVTNSRQSQVMSYGADNPMTLALLPVCSLLVPEVDMVTHRTYRLTQDEYAAAVRRK